MNKKKIAIIGLKGLPARGGAASIGESIVKQLDDVYDFTIYSISSHTDINGPYGNARQIVFREFPIKKLNILYYYIISAVHALVKGKYDIIHLHHMDAAFILIFLRIKYYVLSTSHGLTYKTAKWSNIYYPYFKLNEWFFAKMSSHLTVVSKSLIKHYSKLMPLEKITYIPNGVEIPLSNLTANSDSDYILFSAGRIIPVKGLDILLRAMHLISNQTNIVILGDYAQIPKYKKELFSLAKGLNVEFKGLIKDKYLLNKYLKRAKLFIFPSTFEAMSMMLLEAAAMKVPIICSDIEQNKNVFSNNEVLYFISGNHEDLSQKIMWALSNYPKMERYADNAYLSVLKNYQLNAISDRYKSLYELLIRKTV